MDWQMIWDELGWDDEGQRQRLAEERLRQRARAYAAPKADPTPEAALLRVLSFRLGDERYGLEVQAVRGVRPLGQMARLPHAPPFYVGILSQRGQMVTVCDLRPFFGLAIDPQQQPPQEVVLIEGQGLRLALLAHHVEDVQTVLRADIGAAALRYARGVTLDRLIILDLEALLSDERLRLT